MKLSRWNAFVAVLVALPACSSAAEQGDQAPARNGQIALDGLSSINGVTLTNGLGTVDGVTTVNGVTAVNGLATLDGVATLNGLVTVATMNGVTMNGLDVVNGAIHAVIPDTSIWINDPVGRDQIGYLIRCALNSTQTITRQDSAGITYRFTGEAGFAPWWASSPLGPEGEEWVSACMMAHLNVAGQHVQFEMRASAPSVGYGGTAPYAEAGFWGNIFQSPPHMYFCNDENGFDGYNGRVCGGLSSGCQLRYVGRCDMPANPYLQACAAHGQASQKDGYTTCNAPDNTDVWSRPVATHVFSLP